MNIQKFALSIAIATAFLSCGPSRERMEELEKAAAKEETAILSSTAAKNDPHDSMHSLEKQT
jgi:hypothetical protein